MSERWFTVGANVTVRADDEDAAVNRVAALLRGEGSLSGVFPVADFSAREVEDPLARGRAHLSEED